MCFSDNILHFHSVFRRRQNADQTKNKNTPVAFTQGKFMKNLKLYQTVSFSFECTGPGPKVIKFFSCSTELSMEF